MMIELLPEVNRAFSAGGWGVPRILGRCPSLEGECCALGAKHVQDP
jgi:hypothetical protein